jgi:hypothetical protein
MADFKPTFEEGQAEHLMLQIQLETWEAINNAQRRAALVTSSLDVKEFRFTKFGAESIKKGIIMFSVDVFFN